MIYTLVTALYIAVAFSAGFIWMKPLLLWFDDRYRLPHCQTNDFTFYCFTWPVVLAMISTYVVWQEGFGTAWNLLHKGLHYHKSPGQRA